MMSPADSADTTSKRDREYRARILEAASRLLARNGIDSVNMYQIAQEAGIGQGTLYRRYEHPGQIFSELLLTNVEQFLDELESQLAADGPGSTRSALEQLDDLLARIVEETDRHAELLSAITCMYAGRKDFLQYKRPFIVRLHELINSCLIRAAEQGETREIDPTLTAHIVLSSIAPKQYLHLRDELGYSKEQFLAGIRRVFIEGIRTQQK